MNAEPDESTTAEKCEERTSVPDRLRFVRGDRLLRARWMLGGYLLLLAACAGPEQHAPQPPIILISVDTLRSDRLPVYGYGQGSTPNIDALRRDSVLHERAYSHAPLTLPSHLSMLTGLLPTEHGVRNNIGYRFDRAKHRGVAGKLREAGYRTGAAVSSYVLRSATGIAHGFDAYDDNIVVAAGAATSENQRSGFETLEAARAFAKANAQSPFFLFFHIYEPHAPYTPPEPYRSAHADPYDGEIAAADAVVGQLLDTLRQQGLYDRSMIVFTSDHGEALWEHGEDQHGILLYREVLQVPLLIKYPQNVEAGTSSAAPYGLQRIHDDILKTAGLEVPPRPDGPIYSETLYPRIHLGWSELRSLIAGNHHFIESSRPELYDLVADPREQTNILSRERRVSAELRRELAALPAPTESLERIDPEEAKKLAALGYVGTPQQRTGPLPNPRDQIHVLRDLKQAFHLAAGHRNDEAVAAMRKLLETNPALMDVSTRLGEVLVESGRYTEAVDVYRAAIARSGRLSPELALAMAIALLKAGNHSDAAAHAELALEVSPAEAHEVLTYAAIETRRFDDAARHAQSAIEASKRSPSSLLLIAEVQRSSGRYEDALRSLEVVERRASELGVLQRGIDHARGDLFARTDRPDESIAAYRREITRFPDHLQSYANLALIYRILERNREAEEVLEALVRANPHAGARALAKRTRDAWREV
jgi:choline-sulfatase